MIHLMYAMEVAMQQIRASRYFAFEHPSRATSWGVACVKDVARMPGVETIVFDMCQYGLRSKEHQIPMRKRTKVMTNSPKLASLLRSRPLCNGNHAHQCITGCEGGMTRAAWAQIYPAGFVEVLGSAVEHHVLHG